MYCLKGSFGEDSLFMPFTSGKKCTAGTRDNESPFRANEPQAADYLLHVAKEDLIAIRMGIHWFLQKHR